MSDWRTLPAGPELDANVAERVFGQRVEWRSYHRVGKSYSPYYADAGGEVDDFSTTWDGMGLVVERMRELGWEGAIYLYNQEPIECIVAPVGDRCKDYDCTHRELGQANTAPLAVCRAALAALEASA